jgi:hypothetical protein
VAFDPADGNVSYMEFQQGYMFRHQRDSNELVHIQPQPAPGDPPERWNWDTPILISPHDSSRVYVGSQRLWRSDDRGDSWQAVSGDLTTNQNRYELGYRGRVWSVEALHDNDAMSKYSTITAISESPVSEGVIYTGSDDGLIYTSVDGGDNWQQARVLPAVPGRSFINDIEASLYDADTVFAIADAHKTGDYSPYVFVSTNKGRNWRSISGDLPKGTIAWAIQQDHIDENLLFLGSEYGVYFTVNGGENWHRIAGAPTIAFRDIKIQRRDNDLVGATFGRGIYILDDYSALRLMAADGFGTDATLFPVRDAWWYIPSAPGQAIGWQTLGSDSFRTPNPDFGASITYYLDKKFKTGQETRKAAEEALRERGEDVPFPGWERLVMESLEIAPRVMILVRDGENNPVRWLPVSNEEGTHRVSWDLRLPAADAIDLSTPEFVPPWGDSPQGPLVAPGMFTAQLHVLTGEEVSPLGQAQQFRVKPVRAAPDGTDYAELANYHQAATALLRQVAHASEELGRTRDLLRHMNAAAVEAPQASPSLFARLDAFGAELSKLETRLSGDQVRDNLNVTSSPSITNRANNAANAWRTTQSVTATQKADLEIAKKGFAAFSAALEKLLANDLVQLESELNAAGAPSWR